MEIVNCSKADFDQIIGEVSDFWGNDLTLHLHHPMFVYEFGNTAFVIREGGKVLAYLLGFLSQTSPAGYVHLVGVRLARRRRGLGRRLYDSFRDYARAHGCSELKAITTPTNASSIAFHRGLGMRLLGDAEEGGIPFVRDYGGPGQHRVVFHMDI